ncbi:phage tail protein I [Endozoicomonas montiporae]|uniref:phage tail protein I n=1 Tax=Endozoicomonas montiporae TaxID=1027273 RepID=UPI00068F1ABD|nr:phage tail protein I [Endozoicomonas montiporae]
MSNEIKSILPSSTAEFEQRLDIAVGERLSEINIPTETLWDAWRCPEWWLPYLAYAVSVDFWRAEWPEETKRRVIASSLDRHRIKGTAAAVRQAIKDIRGDAQLIEWFHEPQNLKPGEFAVEVNTGDSGYDPKTDEELTEAIHTNKNTRSHLKELRITAVISGDFKQMVYAQTGDALECQPWNITATISDGSNKHLVYAQIGDVIEALPWRF